MQCTLCTVLGALLLLLALITGQYRGRLLKFSTRSFKVLGIRYFLPKRFVIYLLIIPVNIYGAYPKHDRTILIQLFQSAIFSATSAKDLDFIDPEVEAQMDEEEEITIRGARGVGKDLIISIHPKTYLCSPSCLNSCLN